jgi:hypothetical protein
MISKKEINKIKVTNKINSNLGLSCDSWWEQSSKQTVKQSTLCTQQHSPPMPALSDLEGTNVSLVTSAHAPGLSHRKKSPHYQPPQCLMTSKSCLKGAFHHLALPSSSPICAACRLPCFCKVAPEAANSQGHQPGRTSATCLVNVQGRSNFTGEKK